MPSVSLRGGEVLANNGKETRAVREGGGDVHSVC